MRYTRQLCRVNLLRLSGPAVAANVRLQVERLSGQLKENVRVQPFTTESDEVAPDRRFHVRVGGAIREGSEALDYYQPIIEFDLRPPPEKGRQVLIVKIASGVPVLIGGTDVVLRNGAWADKDYLELLDICPATGTVLSQSDYENLKKSLTSIVSRKGYFDSEFTKAQLGIALGLHKASRDIDYNSGERYRSGHVAFEGSQIRDEHLQNPMPSKEGDEYESKDLAELNRRPSVTGQFNPVVVAPQFDKACEMKVLPLTGVALS